MSDGGHIDERPAMGQILIRDLDDSVIKTLQSRAAVQGHTLEDEVRDMLIKAAQASRATLVERLREIQAMTPPGPRTLAEDLIREGRDER